MRTSIARHARRGLPILIACLALASTACVSTSSSVGANKPPEGPWLEPSPNLREQIEEKAKRFPWTHGLERVELIQWFAGVGEPAYSTLLEFARDPRPDVSGAALAALGATRDSRLVLHLRAIPSATGPGSVDLNLERARTLLRLGDWDTIPQLIHGLHDDRLITRALCSQALFEATRERFDFDPRGEPDARQASIEKWNAWWTARNADPLLKPETQAQKKADTDEH
ncbi:MAG: hypothetical protein ACKVXR_13430 [Planctomycetota bacterium]